MNATRINPADVSERCKRCARYNPDAATATGPEWYSDTAPCRGMYAGFAGCICFQPRPVQAEIILRVRNNPRDQYGPPRLGFIVKATDPNYHCPLYIRTSSAKGYTWTQDPTHARHFSRKTAQRHADYLSDLDALPNP